MSSYLRVLVGDIQCAIDLKFVEHVFMAITVSESLELSNEIIGYVNYDNASFPVVSMKKALGFDYEDISLDDHFILVRCQQHKLVLIVDQVIDFLNSKDVEVLEHQDLQAESNIHSAIKYEHETILVFDVNRYCNDVFKPISQ